jgi:hypothetical protein
MKPEYKIEILKAVNEVETKLKLIVKNGALKLLDFSSINVQSEKLIQQFMKTIPQGFYYRDEILRGLRTYKMRLFLQIKSTATLGFPEAQRITKELLKRKVDSPKEFIAVFLENAKNVNIDNIYDVSNEGTWMSQKGAIPIVNYYKKLRQGFVAMAKVAIKEGTERSALSLRSLVELSLRKQYHEDSMNEFKEGGAKLVWVSTHSDASKRCAPWQGKLYSLDGTTGTQDGNKFFPIEKATDVFTTTKKGRIFKNGLFGYNCRHYMIQYTYGSTRPLDYGDAELKKEREISSKQRAMERQIFKLKHEAVLLKDIDPQRSSELRKLAAEKKRAYIQYSEENSHAYYPDRISIPDELLKVA